MTAILVIAHVPLASALRECALHVFPESAADLFALDVLPHDSPDVSLVKARHLLAQSPAEHTLMLTDVFGATPCNVAQKLLDGVSTKLISGVSLPMLLRAVSYRHESLDALLARAMAGATQGILQVGMTAPQNQAKRANHDQDQRDHQQ